MYGGEDADEFVRNELGSHDEALNRSRDIIRNLLSASKSNNDQGDDNDEGKPLLSPFST